MYKLITLEVKDRVAHLQLNRPDKRNALNGKMVSELRQALRDIHADDNVKVVVLSGAGKAFCAGADLAYLEDLQSNTFEENLDDSRNLKALFQSIYHLPKPVIAKVTGHAIAGGAGLATVCDLVYSVPEAKYGYTEVKIGFVPALVSVFLLRKCGEALAKDLLLTGRLISADEAVAKGCFTATVSAENIDEAVDRIAQSLCTEASADSLRLTKLLIANVQDHSLAEGLETAATCNAEARETPDCKKGIASFLNKEKIAW